MSDLRTRDLSDLIFLSYTDARRCYHQGFPLFRGPRGLVHPTNADADQIQLCGNYGNAERAFEKPFDLLWPDRREQAFYTWPEVREKWDVTHHNDPLTYPAFFPDTLPPGADAFTVALWDGVWQVTPDGPDAYTISRDFTRATLCRFLNTYHAQKIPNRKAARRPR